MLSFSRQLVLYYQYKYFTLGIPYDGRTAEVWSLGCILYIVTTGSMPFDDSNKSEQMKQMKRGPNFVRSKQYLTETLKCLILSMLDNNATKRVTLNEVENHPWLANVILSPQSSLQKRH